jgi:hypothetical protein
MRSGGGPAAFLMKALQQLSFLKFNLRPEGTPGEDTRVLALFRNRAELKKAYGALQEEIFRLKDLIKQQEAATQRAQDMLGTLEARLGAPETAYPALVFYQLRRLWQSGRELLAAFVADLVRQQEERERRAHLAQHNRRQFARRQVAENELRIAQARHLEAGAQAAALAAEHVALARWWHYLRRRALQRRIDAAQAALASAGAALGQAQLNVEAIARESTPQFPGLSLPARRAINLATIAYAEVLCLRLTELKTPLVTRAREASGHREAGDDYGSPQQCVLLMAQISRALGLISARGGLSGEIKARSERLSRVARYRSNNDSSPLVDSLAFSEADTQAVGSLALAAAAPLPNVLAEDTWDLFRVLLR